jgi:hypothetical protein
MLLRLHPGVLRNVLAIAMGEVEVRCAGEEPHAMVKLPDLLPKPRPTFSLEVLLHCEDRMGTSNQLPRQHFEF